MIGKLWPFALGSVALGLDAYVIAGLLPAIAGSLKASESSVGLGVAAFTGSYAIAGPILAGRAGQRSKQSLTIALAVFMLANVGTAVTPSIVTFLAARAIAGAAAGVYSPLSSAVAAGIVEPGRQGRALSLVLSGLAVGTVFGVPTGLIIAARWGWRATITLIAVIGGTALLGMGLKGGELPSVPASGPAERWRSIARRGNLLTITVTLLTAVASLGLYTYLTVVLGESDLVGNQTVAIWVWGIGGAIGALSIGTLIDRKNPLHTSLVILAVLTVALFGMTADHTTWLMLASLFLWGLCGWASVAPQQHILLAANPSDGATAVAANASANYLGAAMGSVLGSGLIALRVSPRLLPVAACAVALTAFLGQLARTQMTPSPPRG